MNFASRVAVVTGASSGIGRRTALELAVRGATLCVAARREERLVELVGALPGTGHSHRVTDVSRRQEVRALATHVRDHHGRCDILVNNAGFSGEREFDGPEAVADLEAIMQTNFFGVAYCTAEFLPLLLEAAPSSVVNVASVAGRLAIGGAPAYTASKFAVVGWSEALHGRLVEKGVHVSLVEPGLIPTEGFPQTAFVDDPLLKHALGTEADVAAAILDAIERRKPQRVVPRWYYMLQFPRLISPGLYRAAQKRLIGSKRRSTA